MQSDAVLFGGIYGRFTAHRFLMSYFLETQLHNQSFVIFQPSSDHLLFELDPVKIFYQDQINWAQQRTEKNRTYISRDDGTTCYPDVDEITRDYQHVWSKYKIEIICETNLVDYGWFTEKTARCLRTKKPFLLLGTAGQLKKLQIMGFKTFADAINEDYDNIENLDERFELITKEIQRIDQLPLAELHDTLEKINSVAQYNAENYSTIINAYYNSFNSLKYNAK
jgi:hypothetical protein